MSLKKGDILTKGLGIFYEVIENSIDYPLKNATKESSWITVRLKRLD